MQYALELYFDRESEENLCRIIQEIADQNLSTKFLDWKTRPHVTLACFNDVDEKACIRMISTFAKEHKQIPASLDSVGMFNDTKTIFAAPTMNKALFDLQKELHSFMSVFDTTGWEWYCPDEWVPHCTLALTGEDDEEIFYRAAELVLRRFRKVKGLYTAIGLVKITFPVTEMFKAELS